MSGIIPDIDSGDIQALEECAYQLLDDFSLSLAGLATALTGRSSYVLPLDTIDGDPPNTTPSYIVPDSDIRRDDQFNSYEILMTSGTASGNKYTITDTTESNNRIHVAENLYSEGVRDGDTFRIMGHRHNGQVGRDVLVDNLIGFEGGAWPQGAVMVQVSGSCPTGWTDVSSTYNNRFLGPRNGAVQTGGSGSHIHNLNDSGGVAAGTQNMSTSAAGMYDWQLPTSDHVHSGSTLAPASPEPEYRTIKLCRKT